MTDLPAATRARLERTLANAEAHGALLPVLTTDMRGLLTAYDALRAAQAQAAPVLAAAAAFEPFMERVAQGEAIPYPQRMRDEARALLTTWRAAREG